MKITKKHHQELNRLGLLTLEEVKTRLNNCFFDTTRVKCAEDASRLYDAAYGKLNREIERIYRPFVYLDWNGRKEMGYWLNTMIMGHFASDGEYFDMINQFNKMILRTK